MEKRSIANRVESSISEAFGGDYINIIELIVAVLSFVLGYTIWVKAVDNVDDWLKEKLSEKTYKYITIGTFIMFFIAIIYTVIR